MPQEIQVPVEWTVFYVGSSVLFFAIVAFGIVLTLRSKRHASNTEKAIWVIAQIILPIIGFVLWLLITSPKKHDSKSLVTEAG